MRNKPPNVVYIRPHHPATTDDSGPYWPDGNDATLAYMKCQSDESRSYVDLEWFLEEVGRRAHYAKENGLVGNEVQWAIQDLAKELKGQK